jgi:hypothetical protein
VAAERLRVLVNLRQHRFDAALQPPRFGRQLVVLRTLLPAAAERACGK